MDILLPNHALFCVFSSALVVVNMAPPAFAAECQRLLHGAVQQTIDISCWQGAQQ